MAQNTCTLTITGTLGRDPELRYTTGGTAVASVGVAVNRSWKKNDEWQEETSWFNVVVWQELAENAAQSLSKGDRVIVTGRMQQKEWEDREGNKRTSMELVADGIGPDLRYATCEVSKIERSKGGSTGNSGTKATPIYGDEEPFVTPTHEREI